MIEFYLPTSSFARVADAITAIRAPAEAHKAEGFFVTISGPHGAAVAEAVTDPIPAAAPAPAPAPAVKEEAWVAPEEPAPAKSKRGRPPRKAEAAVEAAVAAPHVSQVRTDAPVDWESADDTANGHVEPAEDPFEDDATLAKRSGNMWPEDRMPFAIEEVSTKALTGLMSQHHALLGKKDPKQTTKLLEPFGTTKPAELDADDLWPAARVLVKAIKRLELGVPA